MEFLQGLKDQSFVNKVIFPCGGTFYPPADKLGVYHLFWLKNSVDNYFPNIWIPRSSNGVILYSHGNGGTLRDWYAMLKYYSDRFEVAVLGVEYPGYGPAEGVPNEKTVNDNVYTAYDYLVSIGYPPQNIIIMGYSIGTGPSIQLAAELCKRKTPPGCLITIAAFSSIRDIVQDLKGSRVINIIAPMILMERWNSFENVAGVSCPAIFLHGELDTLIPCSHSVKLHSACKSRSKILHFCPKADHVKFREPMDTVEPISSFLSDNFKPTRGVRIEINIPDVKCPRDVMERYEEALVAKKLEEQEKARAAAKASNEKHLEQKGLTGSDSDDSDASSVSSTEVANRGCWDVSPVVNWIFEAASAALLTSSSTKSTLTEDMINTVAANGNGVPTMTKESDSSKEKDSNSSTTQTSSTKYSTGSVSSTSSPSKPLNRSNSSPFSTARASIAKSFFGGTSKSMKESNIKAADQPSNATNNTSNVQISKRAVGPGADIVHEYFAAFNRHDIDGLIATLDEKVVAFYPDESRNWSTTEFAPLHYNRIFSLDPELKITYSIVSTKTETYVSSVVTKCSYVGCAVEDNKRFKRMEFAVQGQRIIFISFK